MLYYRAEKIMTEKKDIEEDYARNRQYLENEWIVNNKFRKQ